MAELNAWWLVTLAVALLGGAFVAMRARQSVGGKPQRARDSKPNEAGDTLVAWTPTATCVLTRSEREAFHILRKALPDHMILAQVPLARFLRVPTRNSYSEWLRRVGSLCADIVVCDAASQVVAVIELRQPARQEKPRTLRRHARMDRVLEAAGIAVHVWLEGALPGPAVARVAVLGSAVAAVPTKRSIVGANSQARRSAEAAAVVASMQAAGSMHGLSVEDDQDFNMDDFVDDEISGIERKDPPPSTWFDDMDSAPVPLDTATHH